MKKKELRNDRKKTCYNCGNKNCHIFYATVKQDIAVHHETYEYTDFDCVNHDKWKEMKVEEIRTDNTKTLKNALERIAELEKENAELKVEVEISYEVYNDNLDYSYHIEKQLTKAKKIIKNLMVFADIDSREYEKEYKEAEQFLKEVV